jgi:aspartyl-tRNA(Asn)/glutamyl-tRNA(Gln) amidotransferase subunit C
MRGGADSTLPSPARPQHNTNTLAPHRCPLRGPFFTHSPPTPPPPQPQVAAWEPTLQKIAGWFDQLQAVDVEGVPPATDAGVGAGSTRPDVVDTGLAAAADALGQVPDRDGAFVRVPKVM